MEVKFSKNYLSNMKQVCKKLPKERAKNKQKKLFL